MYSSINFKTKKDFKAAVTRGEQVRIISPFIFPPPENGKTCIEGPWYPKPHTWYATVEVKDGIVIKVS